MLKGLTILIVEDEALLALDLCDAVEAEGGRTLGPFATIAEAFDLAGLAEGIAAAGAILDANLRDRDVTPLALHLLDRGMPFVVHTGTGLPVDLARLHPDLPVVMKPTTPAIVIGALAEAIAGAGRDRG